MSKTIEWCSHCDAEAELDNDFKPQICSSCGVRILPCSICEQLHTDKGCSECPLEK